MINNILKLSAVMAVSIYIFFIVLLLYYFNHHTDTQNRHYVKKNDERIAVSLAAASANKPKQKSVKATSHTPSIAKKKRAKKVKKRRKKSEKVIKKIKKSKVKKTKSKHKAKKKVSNLFNKVKSKQPSKSTSKSKGSSHSMKKNSEKKLDKGIENAYFAKIEDVLASWPAQSEFAGEKIIVWIKVKSDGSFTFKLLSHSNNRDFNSGLIQYLKQLQKIGFDAHKNVKPYELNIEFIAKE